ncbi:unnamed protein product [Moneuplotes crassus]|uniref:Uncharacterized protein n=2 Tax=Euplotes crassus TaxID=5936 RepID=A0AAD1XM55_EUPCR|nr:unnamed protein product [Moneuplotes crassus]
MLSDIHDTVRQNLESFGHKHTHLMAAFCLYGAYTVGSTALGWSWRFFKTFLRPSKNLFKRYHGGYVVVTGATNGLGLGYARKFAEKGFNLVLVARNSEKLNTVKSELLRSHPDIDIKLIQFDFDKPYTEEGYASLKESLDMMGDISVLVNNVGAIGTNLFEDMPIDIITRVMNVNLIPQVVMTKFLLPRLLRRSKEEGKRTAILSVSSAAHYIRLPKSTMYSCTKSFNKTFSDVIGKEYGKYIDVMVTTPGPVISNMVNEKAPFVITPEAHARWVLSDLGYNTETFGHYRHWMSTTMFRLPLLGTQFIKMRDRYLNDKSKSSN